MGARMGWEEGEGQTSLALPPGARRAAARKAGVWPPSNHPCWPEGVTAALRVQARGTGESLLAREETKQPVATRQLISVPSTSRKVERFSSFAIGARTSHLFHGTHYG